jgi:hypothetical protein
MTTIEIKEHMEFIDGIQKAQMLTLRLILREMPNLKQKLEQYAIQMDPVNIAGDLTLIQFDAMKKHLLELSK